MDILLRLCLLVAGAALAAGAAFAQAATPETPTAPGQNLSKQLDQSNGVIHPKEVDPAIEKPAPKTGDSNVVPPPGTSGGAPARSMSQLARPDFDPDAGFTPATLACLGPRPDESERTSTFFGGRSFPSSRLKWIA